MAFLTSIAFLLQSLFFEFVFFIALLLLAFVALGALGALASVGLAAKFLSQVVPVVCFDHCSLSSPFQSKRLAKLLPAWRCVAYGPLAESLWMLFADEDLEPFVVLEECVEPSVACTFYGGPNVEGFACEDIDRRMHRRNHDTVLYSMYYT